MQGFNVTFETVTPESAENGDAATRGFIGQDLSLRDALADLDGYGCHVEADCCPVSENNPPRWFTAYNVREDYATAAHENRSLHIPDSVTAASRLRIARLLGCHGIT